MLRRALAFIRSDKAVPTASALIIVAAVAGSSLLSIAACALWLAYLLYWLRHTEHRSLRWACAALSLFAAAQIVGNFSALLRG